MYFCIRQCCISAHGGIMQPCTMWYLQEREHARYLPPIFSWLTALATLSRLLRDFSSGSAIFPLNLGPLVLSFSSCPPFPSTLYVPFLLLPGFPLCLLHTHIQHTHTHTHTPPPTLSLTLPDSSSLTRTHAHSPLHLRALPSSLRLEFI